jgi:hypothetical protein
MVALTLAFSAPALADDVSDDPILACDRAAVHAETAWHLPAGLLAAIGTVESGRRGLGSALPVAWPWSINVGGRGLYQPSKAAAIAAVRAFQAGGRGLQAIDVGCFQVDLFYHPQAFATLDAAFDPEANAKVAARVLTLSRFDGGSWEAAIALYHAASPTRGAQYLRQVQAVWASARTRSAAAQEAAYAVLLSPAARQVRVIAPADPPAPQTAGLPRVLGPQTSTAAPQRNLPIVLLPPPRVPPNGRCSGSAKGAGWYSRPAGDGSLVRPTIC